MPPLMRSRTMPAEAEKRDILDWLLEPVDISLIERRMSLTWRSGGHVKGDTGTPGARSCRDDSSGGGARRVVVGVRGNAPSAATPSPALTASASRLARASLAVGAAGGAVPSG